MRTSILLAGAIALAGCGDSHTDTDAALPDAGSPRDGGSSTDGGPAHVDAGRDATTPPMDAGVDVDAGEADGGSLLDPVDAGDPFGDAGALGAPEWVELDVLVDGSECAPLVACGGDEVGTWDVTGGCVALPEVAEALGACPGATITAEGEARGRVTFDGSFAVRTAQWIARAEVFVPSLCASFVGCSTIEAQIRTVTPDARCVSDEAGACTCAARLVNVIDDADGYTIDTIEDNQIVSAVLGRRWDYCVDGESLRYREVSGEEPGIVELGRR